MGSRSIKTVDQSTRRSSASTLPNRIVHHNLNQYSPPPDEFLAGGLPTSLNNVAQGEGGIGFRTPTEFFSSPVNGEPLEGEAPWRMPPFAVYEKAPAVH